MQRVIGIARTIKGPNMSRATDKIEIVGVGTGTNEKVITLIMIQGRNPDSLSGRSSLVTTLRRSGKTS